jgi:hypothetical protein
MKILSLIIINIFLYIPQKNEFKMYEKKTDVVKIEIYYIHLGVTTQVYIQCGGFEKSRKKVLLARKDICTFLNYFEETIKANNIYEGEMDARGKIKLYFKDGHIENYCFGNYILEYQGKIYYYSDQIESLFDLFLE